MGVRAQFGTIAVIPLPGPPSVEVDTPAKGGAAGAGRGVTGGAADGAKLVAAVFSGCGGWGCILVIPAVGLGTLIGAVAGGIHGGITAPTSSVVEHADAVIHVAATQIDANNVLRDRVLECSRGHTAHTFAPASVDSVVAGHGEVPYQALAGDGGDTVVEVGVQQVKLTGPWRANPELALVLVARARVVRTRDGSTVHEETFQYESPTRHFTDWAANSADQFRFWVDFGLNDIAKRIAGKLFVLVVTPDVLPAESPPNMSELEPSRR